MRHRLHHRKLNRTSEHRVALRRNLAQSIIEHGQITTTLPKAKDVRPFVERLITLAVKTRQRAASGDTAGSLVARRTIHRLMSDRGIVPADHQADYDSMSDAARHKTMRMASGRRHRTGEPKGRLAFTAESVTHRLIETVAPRFEDRSGGYTRLVRLSRVRLGDNSSLAVVQLIGEEEAPVSVTKPRKTARRRRADARYAFAISLTKDAVKSKRRSDSESEVDAGSQNADATASDKATGDGEE